MRKNLDFLIVFPPDIVEKALSPAVTAAELKSAIKQHLNFGDEEVDWLDCEMEFAVTPEQRATIEDAIKAAMLADPPTKQSISKSAQMLDVMMKLSQEFLGAHPSE